jgi:hypothetical protein
MSGRERERGIEDTYDTNCFFLRQNP